MGTTTAGILVAFILFKQLLASRCICIVQKHPIWLITLSACLQALITSWQTPITTAVIDGSFCSNVKVIQVQGKL